MASGPSPVARTCALQSDCGAEFGCVNGICGIDTGKPTLIVAAPAADGACAAVCTGAVVRAADTSLVFSGTVDDTHGLQGPLAVAMTRGGTTVAQANVIPSGNAWSWSWDTSALTDDGQAYVFAVTATNTVGNSTSAGRTVWVDRVPPSTQTLLPANAATGVWPLDPIQVTFSEPIAAGSVTDVAVTVLTGTAAVTKRLSLSQDGRTLTVKMLTPPTIAGQLAVSFAADPSALTDIAGNPVAPPGDWTFTSAPIWEDLEHRTG